jgi:hypothetical protein
MEEREESQKLCVLVCGLPGPWIAQEVTERKYKSVSLDTVSRWNGGDLKVEPAAFEKLDDGEDLYLHGWCSNYSQLGATLKARHYKVHLIWVVPNVEWYRDVIKERQGETSSPARRRMLEKHLGKPDVRFSRSQSHWSTQLRNWLSCTLEIVDRTPKGEGSKDRGEKRVGQVLDDVLMYQMVEGPQPLVGKVYDEHRLTSLKEKFAFSGTPVKFIRIDGVGSEEGGNNV